MEIKIICARSKKGNIFHALTINGVYVTFDVNVMTRVAKCEIRDIYLLSEGDEIVLYAND